MGNTIGFVVSSCIALALPAFTILAGQYGKGYGTKLEVISCILAVVAIFFLHGLWKSKSTLLSKLARSLFLFVPVLGVLLYSLLDRPKAHGDAPPERLYYLE